MQSKKIMLDIQRILRLSYTYKNYFIFIFIVLSTLYCVSKVLATTSPIIASNKMLQKKDATYRTIPIQVVRVLDGDSIIAMRNGKREYIRLFGIDAPEYLQKWGAGAKNTLQRALFEKKVTMHPIGKDSYGRTIAVIYANAIDVGKILLMQGYAYVYKQYCQKRAICTIYTKEEQKAQKLRHGIWSTPQQEKPWEYRRKKQ